ncbi:nucleoside triphosphate pyrophosphohydrolase [Bacillus sp. JJ1609]|uniref:nucleoside triphosphate pyrophosphohydrolase n=1 Tax=Bacillus sp. JJ1609 TaxID=3122977 RepID=UPI003000AA48
MKIHNKLVRDNIPEIIEREGKKANFRTLTDEEYINELKKKSYEELDEFCAAVTTKEAVEELADLLEIIHAHVSLLGTSFNEIEQALSAYRGWTSS